MKSYKLFERYEKRKVEKELEKKVGWKRLLEHFT